MPLTPRFSWEEDAANVALQVTLPGAALKSVDIYISDLVVKVNAAPYVLLLDLLDCVEDASAVVKRNATTHVLHISVQKKEAKLWRRLTYEASKAELKERRLASMERKRQAETSLAEKRKDRKYQEEKQTLRAQMAVDDANRQILADLKAEEKAREEAAMFESFQQLKAKQLQRQEAKQKNASSTSRPANNERDHVPTVKADAVSKPSKNKHVSFAADIPSSPRPRDKEQRHQQHEEAEILELNADGSFEIVPTTQPKVVPPHDLVDESTDSDGEVEDVNTSTENNQADEKAERQWVAEAEAENCDAHSAEAIELPPPRAPAQAEIRFTPRLFPTPSRESKAAEEEDWMLKNRKHLKTHKGLHGTTEAYDISESDPAWLKAKGDDFYRSRDYRSAVNAYSEAISVAGDAQADLRLSCLSNRAACHLQLAAFENCLGDCTNALSHLPDTPASTATAQSATSDDHARVIREFRLKLKLLVRRGTALCRLGQYTQAKADYGVALTMDKQNPALQHDYFQLLQLEKSQYAKERGDECFKLNKLDDAVGFYDESLELHPHSIACLSNRAACFLRQHEPQRCVDDCSSALVLLQQSPAEAAHGNNATMDATGIAFFAVGPASGTAKRREWVVKTLVRRGTAYAAMKDVQQAERDYSAAVELDPSNAALQSDLAKIRDQLNTSKTEPVTEEPPSVVP